MWSVAGFWSLVNRRMALLPLKCILGVMCTIVLIPVDDSPSILNIGHHHDLGRSLIQHRPWLLRSFRSVYRLFTLYE
jgi:hypothetical protein